ncbi:hypothetical protein PLICRDRAFT_113729 [Plicaturopsis crispa FD-325 SS-3]|nr:hypothetical protein PLICRDRAFT_113729 [Plicaturopsis crispa FD-325 SS-3]
MDLQSVSFPPLDDPDTPRKRWYHYLPLCLMIILILAPHPSLLRVLVVHYLQTLNAPVTFMVHLLGTYALTFLAFCSMIVCVARDPGPVTMDKAHDEEDGEMGLTEALMAPGGDDYSAPGRWCHKCYAPKPERTHHCSQCGRCVLKMDHHCPWMGNKCIGHRTLPAFLHFLCCISLLAVYISYISITALVFAFQNSLSVDEVTPVHEIFLAFAGVAITLSIGSFFLYHCYLVTTNQTTLESLSPFILLRYLPPLPPSDNARVLSDPPLEHELSYNQRRLVKDAHRHVLLYDVGWRQNWAQVCGWKRRWGWVYRLLYGGASQGDGKVFPRNSRADDLLARLAHELVAVDKDI